MEYSEAQENLVEAFKNLAVAYGEFIKAGGNTELKIYRQELLLKIEEGATLGFVLHQNSVVNANG